MDQVSCITSSRCSLLALINYHDWNKLVVFMQTNKQMIIGIAKGNPTYSMLQYMVAHGISSLAPLMPAELAATPVPVIEQESVLDLSLQI